MTPRRWKFPTTAFILSAFISLANSTPVFFITAAAGKQKKCILLKHCLQPNICYLPVHLHLM
jgi:hypothetical protein